MQKKTSIEKINELVEKYNISETIKQAIIQISKDAYITGHTDCFNQIKDVNNLINK